MVTENNEFNLPTTIESDKSTIKEMDVSLTKKTEDLVEDILNEYDPKKIKDLTYLFNIAQTKKSVLRTLSYNTLLDRVNDQMEERLAKRADQFSNKDLLDYMDKISTAMDKAQKQIKDIDTTPAIQINQQNIILENGSEELSRESRQNVMDAVSAILKRINSPAQEIEIDEEETVLIDDSIDEDDGRDAIQEANIITLNEEDIE